MSAIPFGSATPVAANPIGMSNFCSPADTAGQVSFAAKPIRCGEWWYIVATHPSGQQEDVTGFHSAAEVEEWLAGIESLAQIQRLWELISDRTPFGQKVSCAVGSLGDDNVCKWAPSGYGVPCGKCPLPGAKRAWDFVDRKSAIDAESTWLLVG